MKIERFLIVGLCLYGIGILLRHLSPWLKFIFLNEETGRLAGSYFLVEGSLIGLSFLLLNPFLAYWVYKHAKNEDTNPTVWMLIALFIGFPGVFIYFAYFAYINTKSVNDYINSWNSQEIDSQS